MLPIIIKRPDLRCNAKAKHSGQQCKNLRSYSCSKCRFHGARKPSNIPTGADHPKYIHGKRTKEAIAKQLAATNVLRSLEQALVVMGAMERRLLTKAKLPKGCPTIFTVSQVERLILKLQGLNNK